MMQVKWKKLLLNLIVWATTELFLNFLGIDSLANYGEFVFERESVILLG
jgi:hypothetical protein